jgi:hypothetical protein
MRKLFVCLIVGSIAAVCPALVVNETFDGTSAPEGWTSYVGAGGDYGSSFAYPEGYLESRTGRSDDDNGASYCKISLGDDSVEPFVSGVPGSAVLWNEMPEITMSVDIKWLGSVATTDPSTMIGLFNDDGDNDRDPGFNFLGACVAKGSALTRQMIVYLRAFRGDGQGSTQKTVTGTAFTMTGAVGDTYRISMHFYQGETDYLGDITVADLTNSAIPVQSQTGLLIIGGGWSFERGLDSFGVHNALGTDALANLYALDNMNLNIPEPATIAILSIGGLIALRRRK